jgi:hypothetical protein
MPVRFPSAKATSSGSTTEIGAVDRAAEVSNEHSTAFQVQSQADTFHQMGEDDLRLLARLS